MNCYNGENYLRESISSVISQNFKNWELIFYDNCSTDKSYKIFKSFADKRLKYFKSKKKKPLGIARYEAMNLCTGNYLAFLDADDLWLPEKLDIQVNELCKKDLVFSYSNTIFFYQNKKKKLLYNCKQKSGYIFLKLIENYNISFDTVLFNLDLLKKKKNYYKFKI